MRETPLERAAGCSALLGTDGLVVLETSDRGPIDVPIRDLEFVLVEVELDLDELDRTVAGSLLEVEMVGCLLEEEIAGVLLLLGWLLRIRSEVKGLSDELLIVILLPIRDVMPEFIRPLELLGLLIRVRSEVESLLEVLRVDELDFDELGRVVSCRPSVLKLGAVGVLTDDELEEGRRMLEELVVREVVGRETIDREVVDREVDGRDIVDREVDGRETIDREVVGLDIVDREVVGREKVDRLEVLRLVVILLDGRLDELRLELRLDVTLLDGRLELRLDVALLERLEDVDLEDDLAEEEDFDEDELFRLVLLDRLEAAITGSAISARISTKSTKNRGRGPYS